MRSRAGAQRSRISASAVDGANAARWSPWSASASSGRSGRTARLTRQHRLQLGGSSAPCPRVHDREPHRPRRLDVVREIVDEYARLRRQREPLPHDARRWRGRLAHADEPGVHGLKMSRSAASRASTAPTSRTCWVSMASRIRGRAAAVVREQVRVRIEPAHVVLAEARSPRDAPGSRSPRAHSVARKSPRRSRPARARAGLPPRPRRRARAPRRSPRGHAAAGPRKREASSSGTVSTPPSRDDRPDHAAGARCRSARRARPLEVPAEERAVEPQRAESSESRRALRRRPGAHASSPTATAPAPRAAWGRGVVVVESRPRRSPAALGLPHRRPSRLVGVVARAPGGWRSATRRRRRSTRSRSGSCSIRSQSGSPHARLRWPSASIACSRPPARTVPRTRHGGRSRTSRRAPGSPPDAERAELEREPCPSSPSKATVPLVERDVDRRPPRSSDRAPSSRRPRRERAVGDGGPGSRPAKSSASALPSSAPSGACEIRGARARDSCAVGSPKRHVTLSEAASRTAASDDPSTLTPRARAASPAGATSTAVPSTSPSARPERRHRDAGHRHRDALNACRRKTPDHRARRRIRNSSRRVGQEARGEQQRAAEDHEHAVGHLARGDAAGPSTSLKRRHAIRPASASQRAEDRVGDQDGDRPPDADRLADLDDHRELGDRDDDEQRDEPEWHGAQRHAPDGKDG